MNIKSFHSRASVYTNLWEQERFHIKIKEFKMAALTSCERALLSVFTHVADIYANLLGQKKAFSLEKSSTPTGLV